MEDTYTDYDGNKWVKSFMDLRDYFACAAMQGLLSNPKLQEQILKQGQDWIIESSYAWANSMMKERENDNK